MDKMREDALFQTLDTIMKKLDSIQDSIEGITPTHGKVEEEL